MSERFVSVVSAKIVLYKYSFFSFFSLVVYLASVASPASVRMTLQQSLAFSTSRWWYWSASRRVCWQSGSSTSGSECSPQSSLPDSTIF